MYIREASYDTIVAYLMGYDRAMTHCGYESEQDAFTEWLRNRDDNNCNLDWAGIILVDYADMDKEVATKMLFDLIDEFDAEQDGSN